MDALLVMQALLIATIAVGAAGGLLAWRERPEPGAVPLAILLAGQCWWSATLFFRITATSVSEKVLWVDASWVGIAVLPVAWLFFCLTYTGYSRYRRLRYVVLASVVPAVTAVLALTGGFHDLLYTDSTLVTRGGHEVLVRSPGVWYWVAAGYTYLLGLLGAIPLLQFVRSDVTTFRGQSTALLVGLVAPWVTNALYLLEALPTGGIDPTPVAFSLSAVAFLGALTRFQLFGTSPAPIRPARRSVFDRIESGLVVLDRHNNVVDRNEQAAASFDGDTDDWLGDPIEDAIPQFESLVGGRGGQTVFRSDGGRTYDVSVSELTDTHGRTTGHIATLTDISEYVRQQQRLEVLNRVFRHNVRTNVQLIHSHADHLATHNSERRATATKESALEIAAFSDKIRTVLDVFESGRTEPSPVHVATVVRDCVADVREQYPAVTVDVSVDADAGYVDSVADDVLRNVVENAAEHNTGDEPTVAVEVTTTGDRVRVVVEDDGPGINDEELALLTEQSETPLNHGSGLGLAVVVWGVEIAGGQVRFEENEPTGTVVTVDLPALAPPDTANVTE